MEDLFFAKHGFPQIYPLNSTGTAVEGFITALNEDYFIRLHVIDSKHPKKVSLKGTWKLQHLLKPTVHVLEQHLSLCSTVADMLHEIKTFVEQQVKSNPCSVTEELSLDYYAKVFRQLQAIGMDRICYVGPDFKNIKVKAYDECNREHVLHMSIPSSFPNEGPSYTCDLPEEFVFKWSPVKTLLDVYNHFDDCLSKYQTFWRWMDEVDENTWVLGPENRTRATCKRRIAIAPTASVLVIVNPSCPSAVPACEFLGPEEGCFSFIQKCIQVIKPLSGRFSNNIDQWNESISLLSNLKCVFDMDFPSPLTLAKEELCVDCGICYSYQLEDAIPDVICSNSKCSQPFHLMCLYEWLRVFPSARRSYNKVFGDCPCCSKPIWCTIPEQ